MLAACQRINLAVVVNSPFTSQHEGTALLQYLNMHFHAPVLRFIAFSPHVST